MNDNGSILSIITPVHNPVPEKFRRTVRSVLDVMKPDWEWVVVLHNTHNLTPEKVRELTEGNPSVRIFELRNDAHTPCSPRNLGLKMAEGRYVTFLDHDDELREGFLTAALDKMEQENCDILVGNSVREESGNVKFLYILPLDFPDTEDGYVVPDDPDSKGKLLYGTPIMLACNVIRRSLITENHITFDEDIMILEDNLFMLRCHTRARKVIVMSRLNAYTLVQHEGSLGQKLLGSDDYPVEAYLEPIRRIVNIALANHISPSGFIMAALGLFTRIYQIGEMSQEKKKFLMSEIQNYIPLVKFDRSKGKKQAPAEAES